ncbi:hypothetical protein NUSPORA_00123 [Nucleospora cyclopteri]
MKKRGDALNKENIPKTINKLPTIINPFSKKRSALVKKNVTPAKIMINEVSFETWNMMGQKILQNSQNNLINLNLVYFK